VDGRRTTGGIHARTRSVLVVLQIALSVVLLVSAALMTRSFLALQLVDPGFRSDHLLSFRIAWPGATLDPQNRFRSRDAFNEFGRRLQAELAAQPGVTGVGGVSHLPYDNLRTGAAPTLPSSAKTTRSRRWRITARDPRVLRSRRRAAARRALLHRRR
jgi:putative ABC transport system permease protein